MKNLLELRFRLRAEELRVLAGEMSVEENRAALLRTAEDYERLAQSAELMEASRRRLARLDARPADTDLAATGDAAMDARADHAEDQVHIYRDMAADATALAGVADERSQERWLSLARTWMELAEKLEAVAHSARNAVVETADTD